jgi:hypothetical protein
MGRGDGSFEELVSGDGSVFDDYWSIMLLLPLLCASDSDQGSGSSTAYYERSPPTTVSSYPIDLFSEQHEHQLHLAATPIVKDGANVVFEVVHKIVPSVTAIAHVEKHFAQSSELEDATRGERWIPFASLGHEHVVQLYPGNSISLRASHPVKKGLQASDKFQ